MAVGVLLDRVRSTKEGPAPLEGRGFPSCSLPQEVRVLRGKIHLVGGWFYSERALRFVRSLLQKVKQGGVGRLLQT